MRHSSSMPQMHELEKAMAQSKITRQAKKEPKRGVNRSVSFDPKICKFPAASLEKEELAKLWYNRFEIAAIKADCEETVKAMASRKQLDASLYTTRGLEFRAPEVNRKRQKQKLAALDAVIDAQDIQRKHGINDQTTIAAIYRRHSMPKQEVAHQFGLDDERSIQNTNSESDKSSTKVGKIGFPEIYAGRFRGASIFQNVKRNRRRSSLPFL